MPVGWAITTTLAQQLPIVVGWMHQIRLKVLLALELRESRYEDVVARAPTHTYVLLMCAGCSRPQAVHRAQRPRQPVPGPQEGT